MTIIKNLKFKIQIYQGFTLIELLITVSIIGILVTLVTFGIQNARQSARDARRRSDLEQIAAGLELYRSECNGYPAPASGGRVPSPLSGTTPPGCTGTYITSVPADSQPPRTYSYARIGTTSYVLCAALEQPPNPAGSTASCGSCGTGTPCNYRISRP